MGDITNQPPISDRVQALVVPRPIEYWSGGLDGVAKLLAKAMDGYLDGTGRQAEFFRGISLRKVFRVAHEPGFEHLELLAFSCLLQAFLYAG